MIKHAFIFLLILFISGCHEVSNTVNPLLPDHKTVKLISPGNFSQLEFHLPLIHHYTTVDSNDTTESITIPDAVSAALNNYSFDTNPKHFRTSFIKLKPVHTDSPSLILRLRENTKRPEKSKLTIKSRNEDLLLLNDLPECRKKKYEMDITHASFIYSISSNLRFTWEDNLTHADFAKKKLISVLTTGCPDLFKQLDLHYIGLSSAIPGVVEQYRYTARIIDKALPGPKKIELEFWVFSKDNILLELSFKTDIRDRSSMQQYYEKLSTSLKNAGIVNSNNVSKTNYYFSTLLL